jgi:hypothetical protein
MNDYMSVARAVILIRRSATRKSEHQGSGDVVVRPQSLLRISPALATATVSVDVSSDLDVRRERIGDDVGPFLSRRATAARLSLSPDTTPESR